MTWDDSARLYIYGCERLAQPSTAEELPATEPSRVAPSDATPARTPPFRWAQRASIVTIAVDVPAATVLDAWLQPATISLDLAARRGERYRLRLRLHDAVNVTEGWWRPVRGGLLLTVQKATAGPYWPHLLRGGARPAQMGVDWSRWVDERRDGVRWNELADRQWEWWEKEKRTADDEEDAALWGEQ